jgi:hypothetical protein
LHAPDTGRHYLPIPVIKGVIDSMTYSKLVCFTFLHSNKLVNPNVYIFPSVKWLLCIFFINELQFHHVTCLPFRNAECSPLAHGGWAVLSSWDTFIPKVIEWCILLFWKIYNEWCTRHCTVSFFIFLAKHFPLSYYLD